jgi:hypothetical protein
MSIRPSYVQQLYNAHEIKFPGTRAVEILPTIVCLVARTAGATKTIWTARRSEWSQARRPVGCLRGRLSGYTQGLENSLGGPVGVV